MQSLLLSRLTQIRVDHVEVNEIKYQYNFSKIITGNYIKVSIWLLP